MRFPRLAAVLALATVTAAAPAARAETYEVDGPTCGFVTSVTNPDGPQTALVHGGPMAVVSGDAPGVTVTLTCSLHEGLSHSAPVIASVQASGTGAAVVPPTLVTYDVDPFAYTMICTRVDVDSVHGRTTYYWDEVEGDWSSSPEVDCFDFFPEDDPLREAGELADVVICPVLADVFPPEGDIEGLWDCPPYDS